MLDARDSGADGRRLGTPLAEALVGPRAGAAAAAAREQHPGERDGRFPAGGDAADSGGAQSVVGHHGQVLSGCDGDGLSDAEPTEDDDREEDAGGSPRRASGHPRNPPRGGLREGEDAESPPPRPAGPRRSCPHNRRNPAARHRRQWMKLWNAFRDDQNVTVADRDMSAKTLNLLLERFFSQLSQRNGKDYSVFSVKQMWSTLNCHFSELEPPERRNDLRLPDFDGARRCYEEKMGKGRKVAAARFRRASAPAGRSSRRTGDASFDDVLRGNSAYGLPGAGCADANATPRAGDVDSCLGSAVSADAAVTQFGLHGAGDEDPSFVFPSVRNNSPQTSVALCEPLAAHGPGEDDGQRLRRHQVAMAEIFKGFNLQGANIHLHFH